LKRDYARHDWGRIAKLKGIPFRLPHYHPTTALPATRAYYHLEQQSSEGAVCFAKAVFARYYAGNFDTGDAKAVASMAGELGFDEAEVFNAMSSSIIKERTRQVSEDAVARGVFGSPWFFVGSEPFWGWDRLPMLDQWLAAGSSTDTY
jgi:2-hydroxychromene-2-carboxylate isomerase